MTLLQGQGEIRQGNCRKSSPVAKTAPVPTGQLTLESIRYAPNQNAAVVRFRVGDLQCRTEAPAAVLQSFAKFQAHAFQMAGVWVRDHWAETGRDKAQVWADDVARAMTRGGEGGR
ncbi:MAG: hypothetical protein EXS05_15730 [Planctomycetaceae bacterium]|nr:hypothetical protein [Planctomycetaceae bacterium]